jgi:glycosyltransferase
MNKTISIITATLNSASSIRDCMDSLRSQIFLASHIVIDGGSTDRTMEIVKSYSHVTKIVSEPDDGIYEAMNKGITLATGDIIGILNADDFYANNNVLAKISKVFENDTIQSCYADLVYVDKYQIDKVVRHWHAGDYNYRFFFWGWMPPHPTFFVRRSVYEKYGLFNLDLGSAADYELMLRFLLKHRISTAYIPEVLVKMRLGGASNTSLKNRLKANRMDRKAWEVNGLKPYPWTIPLKPLRKIPQYFVFGQES